MYYILYHCIDSVDMHNIKCIILCLQCIDCIDIKYKTVQIAFHFNILFKSQSHPPNTHPLCTFLHYVPFYSKTVHTDFTTPLPLKNGIKKYKMI